MNNVYLYELRMNDKFIEETERRKEKKTTRFCFSNQCTVDRNKEKKERI